MNCHHFDTRLESLLDGELAADERAACLEHAAGCPACGELLEAVGEKTGTSPGFLESVLQLTIGSACEHAKEQLPALVDLEVQGPDRELIELHLADCSDCQRLASTLISLRRELPRLAEVAVDERFTRQVLAATLPLQIRVRRWWRSQWSTWVRRPRFAMEAAYVGCLLLVMVMGAFSTPVAALPQKGLELMLPDPETPSVWTQANEGLGTFWEGVASLLERAEEDPETSEESP